MATRKPIISDISSYSPKIDLEVERRLAALESRSHVPCGGGSSKLNNEELPDLPPRKESTINDRITALENRLEALIAQLSK